MRFDRQGNEIADFVLNKPAYREALCWSAGDNFWLRIREHAPWAIADFGAALSTALCRHLYSNCFKT
jgi:3-isopropylmalate/(R)-2-methylmalate dehydratase small subunit